MRNQLVANIYGDGKSRSKPLRRRSMKNIMIQHRGYLKLQKFLDHVIKKTQTPKKIHMKGVRFAVKQAILKMKPTPKKKLNINKGLK